MSEHYVYGLHAISALLNNPHRSVKTLYISQEKQNQRIQELLKRAEQRNIPIEILTTQKMTQRLGDVVHQGIAASAGALRDYDESDLKELLGSCSGPALILILDGITDPHNLGACLRTADAAGVDFVMIPKDKNVGITPAVSKVACGAAESVPLVRVTNLARSMEIIKQEGVWIYGAAGEAEQSVYQLDSKTSMALAMGAEGDGLRRLTREHCDGLFALPMLGSVESLNVSVATGISLYEIRRQRL